MPSPATSQRLPLSSLTFYLRKFDSIFLTRQKILFIHCFKSMMDSQVNSGGKIYEKGTVLLTEKPFAFVLHGTLHSERCDYCFAKSALSKCSGCSYAHYCNRECQKKGWIYHKMECPNIRKVAPKQVPDSARHLARIIFRLQKYEVHEQSLESKPKSRTFYDLMSHTKEIIIDAKRMKAFLGMKAILEEYLGKDSLPDSEQLLEIFGRMIINSFVVLDEDLKSVGTALYLAASVFDHSCAPNAVNVFYGTTISIRTIKNLESINFSDIFIPYKEFLDLPSKRQKELEEMYYFLCQCERCTDLQELKDMTCIICPNGSCGSAIPGGLLDVSPICPNCKLEVPCEKLEEMREVVSFTEDNLNKMEEIAYICRVCLRKQEHLLHPMNIYNVKVLSMAFESCIGLEKWDDAYFYGVQAKDRMRKYYGPLNISFGLFLMKLGRIAGILEKLEEERIFELEASNILMLTLGNKHPLIINEVLPYLPQQMQ